MTPDHYSNKDYWLERTGDFIRLLPYVDGIICLNSILLSQYRSIHKNCFYLPMLKLIKNSNFKKVPNKHYDFVFSGTITPYRKEIINNIRTRGFKIAALDSLTPQYIRDSIYAESRIVLCPKLHEETITFSNMRAYYCLNNRLPHIFETVSTPCDMAQFVNFSGSDYFIDEAPVWNGRVSLEGKTILIYPEQGIGDQIQFSRYGLVLLKLGARVIMLVTPTLVSIIQSMHPDIFVTSVLLPAAELPEHDYHISLMSLLGIFNTNLSNIPQIELYIEPSKSTTCKWSKYFSFKNKLQIGIAWSGSRYHVNDHNRSMSLERLRPLFELGVDWHMIQTEVDSRDEAFLVQTPLRDWRSELTDFHETSGLLDQLDLIIAVDTSVAHLSAALGKPTWIMLPYAPDFRWMLERTDSL